MPNMTLKNGSVSAYGLVCGGIDIKHRETVSGKIVDIQLSYNGATYDVDVIIPGEFREWIDLENGSRVIAGWAQFDKLGDARKFQQRLATGRNIQTTGDMFAHCIAAMHY